MKLMNLRKKILLIATPNFYSDRKPIYIAQKWLICTRIQVLQVRLFILQGQKQTEKVIYVRAELSQSAASKKRDSTVA
ncbi:hypothetical protein I4U23_026868 [Adineta vaga]|nr:hypothetical protein I4U23_026868 [Adineta vaga]